MTDTPNPAPQPAPEAATATAPVTVTLDARTMAIAVYALYLIAIPTGGVSAIAGVVIAYLVRKDAPESLQSHFEFQIRTFWIALIAFVVGVLTVWMLLLGLLVMVAAGLWMLVRAVAGLGQVLNNKPYPNPQTYMI